MTCWADLHLQCVVLNIDQHESFSLQVLKAERFCTMRPYITLQLFIVEDTDLLNNACWPVQARLFGTDESRDSKVSIS